MEDYLSESVYCHSGVPQGSHLGPSFFIDDMDSVFRICKHVSALGYTDDLKLFKRIVGVDDCLRFQSDLDRLQDWCENNKFDLNVGECRNISFSKCKSPIEHVYRIGGHELERVDQIKDVGFFLDRKMTFLAHIETIISKLARMLGFIKRLSKEFRDPYTLKTPYASLVRPNLEYASSIWSPQTR
jgi:Reverse transcriptase (RNA-dependent DNA polymerase)